jgi:hypothetical protein
MPDGALRSCALCQWGGAARARTTAGGIARSEQPPAGRALTYQGAKFHNLALRVAPDLYPPVADSEALGMG